MVGPGGVEPPTSRLSGVRSNHLSYEPGARQRAQQSDPEEPEYWLPGKAMRTAQRPVLHALTGMRVSKTENSRSGPGSGLLHLPFKFFRNPFP